MQIINDAITKLTDENNTKSGNQDEIINQALDHVLKDLMAQCENIKGAIISSVDGISCATALHDNLDQNRFSAMSSALLALSDTLMNESHNDLTKNVLIEANAGKIFIMHATDKLLLSVFIDEQANLGLSLAYAKQAIDKIEAILSAL